MGRRTLLSHTGRRTRLEGGWSLVELTISLTLLLAIALFGMHTIVSGFLLQNWSIGQSMTDAYAGIETAYAQRWVFANFPDTRWPTYPAFSSPAVVTIGKTASLALPPTAGTAVPVTATVTRTSRNYQDPATGAVSYLLESYVVYTSGQRKYCKVSKVYRSQ